MPPQATGWVLSGRYRVLTRIGVGGMAEVFRAHDDLLRRDVAVKVFTAQTAAPETATGVERQQVELQTLARLNHPNLITLFDGSISGTEGPGGPAYLVMELVEGPTLAARIADGPIPEPQVREVAVQISDALDYVHAAGMVHRDVKPANILLGVDRTTGDGTVRARLSDFGIVRLLGSERLTSAEFTLGTASYLAPEQARGSDVGPVSDVYSLGLVLIEAFTGVRSFDGPPLEAVMARLTNGPDIPQHLPPPWPALLTAMTALEPAARPTADQVAQALRGERFALHTPPAGIGTAGWADATTVGLAAMGPPPESPDDPWLPADPPPRGNRRTWLLVAAAILVALAIGGFMLLRPTSHPNSPADRQPDQTHSATHPQPSPTPSTPEQQSSDPGEASSTTAHTDTTSSDTGQPSVTAPSTTDAGTTQPSTPAPSTSVTPSVSTTPPSESPSGATSSVATSSSPAA